MSSQSSGSTIRLIVLLVILGLVGFSWYNDTNNRKPKVDELTDKIWNMMDPVDGPYKSDKVQQEIGFKPARSFKIDEYTVEEYKMTRTIPFLSFHSMFVIYDKHGEVFKVAQGDAPTKESITGTAVAESAEYKEPILPRPVAAGGGGPPPGGGEEKKEDEQKDEGKSEEKAGEKSEAKQDQPPAAEQPAAEKPAEGEKKDGGEPKEGDGG
jgi:hypothetical protein